jgi:potassium-transporting ATPase potassium-binding subunit
MAVGIALIRGFARRRSPTIGNFWVDLTRGTLYVLLPICVIAALLLVAQDVPQTLAPSAEVTTPEGGLQTIARGPVATQEAIKLLSGDGGGILQRQFRASVRKIRHRSRTLRNWYSYSRSGQR